MPLNKPWQTFDPARQKELSGSYGAYEIGDEHGDVIYIGYAGARSLFGLRGKIADHFSEREPNEVIRERARRFRYEVNSMYYSRWVDLLARYREDYETLPPGNLASPEHIPTLGRFRWKSWGTPALTPQPPGRFASAPQGERGSSNTDRSPNSAPPRPQSGEETASTAG